MNNQCIYHVWGKVQLTPGDKTLTELCLACKLHREDYDAR